MATKRACLACRARKVKCVPGPRRCERCAALGIQDCVFDPIKKRGIGNTLRMGEACNLCRIKKKKCDAKRPCTTCKQAKTASECVYDEERYPGPAAAIPLYPVEDYLIGGQKDTEVIDLSTTASATDELSGPQQVRRYRRSSEVIREITTGATSSFFLLPSFFHPSIPPELHVPLSFLGEKNLRVQMSNIDATDIDMKSRLWLLVRLLQFGVHLSSKKMEALLQGDLSGTVLNRSFVCGAHVLGMMVTAGTDYSPAFVHFHAMRVQKAWESLAELFGSRDYETCLHAAVLVVSSHVYIRLPQMALLYIQKCCEFIKDGELQFVPTCGRPPKFSENVHEILAALSQTIYWANYLFLMCGGPEPRATAALETQFRQDLLQCYPILFRICPLTMRTQGILLVRDAIILRSVLPSDGVKLGLWRGSCDRMLESLEDFSQKLFSNVKTFREHGDKNAADIVSSSCIACLSHLAVLYEVTGQTDPVAKARMDRLCDLALQRLGELTSELQFDEYSYLDLLLGESWGKSLTVFDTRIKSLPPEESESLRHFRKPVGECYAKFRAGLPDFEPPMIYSLATMEDGRTGESQYPSLMSAETRVRFGI